MLTYAAACCRMRPYAAETESYAEVLLFSSMRRHVS